MTLLSTKLPWELAQNKWPAAINPILSLPILAGNQIGGIVMTANVPKVINHLLGAVPQGWFVTDNTADTTIWRTQAFNKNTIALQASANTTISIWVY